MRIQRLVNLIKQHKVSGITSDSRQVRENFIFVAIKGVKEDGGEFIDEAISKGAKFIVCATDARVNPAASAEFIRVGDTRAVLAKLAAYFYEEPSKKIKVIGITGTNGKTTITYLLEALLKEAGFQAAVIGTVNYRFKNKIIPAENTTPGPLKIQSMLSEMVKNGVDYAALEVSSHALEQGRVGEIDFHSGIFSNLTQDHLDYHKTIKNYFRAKSKLFRELSPKAFAVINNDDPYSVNLKKITPAGIITYGINKRADLTARDIQFGVKYTRFTLSMAEKKIKFKVRLIGRHNIYNMLAAISWGIKEGISLNVIASGLEKFSLVPGRLERIDSQKGFSIFVDYAHTDDALKNVLGALRQLSPARILAVFGCGGDRDRSKRPKMGEVVSALADFSVITNDNPRSENPLAIIKDVESGIRKKNYLVIPDRRKAIEKILQLAQKGDIVLVAGKGHENYQILGDKVMHFDDREEVKECLKSLNY